jgi:hypothetical protein
VYVFANVRAAGAMVRDRVRGSYAPVASGEGGWVVLTWLVRLNSNRTSPYQPSFLPPHHMRVPLLQQHANNSNPATQGAYRAEATRGLYVHRAKSNAPLVRLAMPCEL